ncbi:MAG TPA: hypothetical protein PL151_10615 [Phycisphaerae bacterium]|nr:hypothetical protein [Phycisphaerae bacterium]HOM52776.1 hypothetical protein [Phycisphaerae bacterium]HPU25861.1 hypothetical protein [Phycisphaerae bacterium]HQE28204.1 hypothetical protein [Phycisphaerae bacterium]
MLTNNILAQTTRQLQGPDWFILVCYFVVMLGIGLYFYRFMKGLKDYFTGGNTIPWWLSGVSYWMSSFSAFAFIAYSGLAYKYGLLGVTVYWVTVPATLFSVLFFATRWRRARLTSPVEYIETRYSPLLRQVFAWQGIPVKIIDDALKIVAIGAFISVSLGIGMGQAMFWSSVIMLAYTFMGGLWAVMVTDFVQFVVMMAAVLVLFPLAFHEAGGFGQVWHNSPPGFWYPVNEKFGWIYILTTVLMYCLSYSVNWSLVQRFYCVPTEKDARKVGWLVVFLNIIGPPLMFAPAMAARHFLGEGVADKAVYPLMCAKLLPAGMFGLVVAAMFSATMSMLSGDYNVCASVLTNDVYKRLIRPQSSNRELVVVGRLMTLLVGIVSLGIAFLMYRGEGESLFQNMVTLFSIAVAPVAVPMLGGLVSRRLSNGSSVVGFCIGLGLGLTLFLTLPREIEWQGMTWQRETVILLCSLVATLAATLIAMPFFPISPAAQARVDEFQARLSAPIGTLEEDKLPAGASGSAVLSPFRIVGTTIVLTGVMMLAIQPWIKTTGGSDPRTGTLALVLNLIIGGGLVVLGAIMIWVTRKPRSAPTPTGAVEP